MSVLICNPKLGLSGLVSLVVSAQAGISILANLLDARLGGNDTNTQSLESRVPQVRANGIDIEYESFGRDGDPLILLIMGFGAQLIFWPEALCQGLAAKGFRVVRFDNRDVGKSTHLAGQTAPDPRALFAEVMVGRHPHVPYSLDDMADDSVGLMDALGVTHAHIVGASMGGMIGQLVAINHPDRTKSLVSIMSTTGRRDLPSGNPETLSALFRPPNGTSRKDLIDASVLVQKALAGPGYPSSEAEMGARAAFRTDYAPFDMDGVARQSAALIVAEPRNALLKELRCPALVIHGADDPVLPAAAGRDTAESIPGAELVIIPGMGHDFPSALVPVYLRHIGDFVAKVEAETKV